jgi:hypothetical protein
MTRNFVTALILATTAYASSLNSCFGYGAIATGLHPSYNEVHAVNSTNQATAADAASAALNACNSAHYRNCQIVISFVNACASFYIGYATHKNYAATADSLSQAGTNALGLCGKENGTCFPPQGGSACDHTQTTSETSAPIQNPSSSSSSSGSSFGALMDAFGFFLVVGLIVLGIRKLLVGTAKPYRNLKGIKTVGSDAAPSEAQKQAREQTRQNQLAALRAAVPSAPPERMRATIQTNQLKVARIERRRVPHLLGEDAFTYVETGEDFKFSVDMILEMSEAERALIKEHELDDMVLEDEPLYTEAELANLRRQDEQEVSATKGLVLEQIKKQVNEMSQTSRKEQRHITRVGDLLVSPFSRLCDSPHEAKEYADKLKTKFLPEVRKLLDGYSGHKQTETLEF